MAKLKPGAVTQADLIEYLDSYSDFSFEVGVLKTLTELEFSSDHAGSYTDCATRKVPYLTGQVEKSPREAFLYCNDDQQLTALRYDNWKIVFMEQRVPGTMRIWAEPFTTLRVPKIFNLRMDPYERADITSNTYYDWLIDHVFLLVPAQDYVGQFLMTFKDYPQRQKAASFNLDEVMKKLQESGGSK